jgi:hypothetical protein
MSVARPRQWWEIAGIVLVVLIAIAGLAILAFIVLFMVAMANFGSNK